jgi:hypothetical protein
VHQGRKFSLKGLLADGSKHVKEDASDTLAPEFEGGSMFVFRLAPQVRQRATNVLHVSRTVSGSHCGSACWLRGSCTL